MTQYKNVRCGGVIIGALKPSEASVASFNSVKFCAASCTRENRFLIQIGGSLSKESRKQKAYFTDE